MLNIEFSNLSDVLHQNINVNYLRVGNSVMEAVIGDDEVVLAYRLGNGRWILKETGKQYDQFSIVMN